MGQHDQESKVFYRNWRRFYPLVERAEGIYLYDITGKRYIDGAGGGAAVVNIGHGVKEVIDAMVEQAKKVCYAHIWLFTSEAQEELAREIISFSPPGMSKVYFLSGGSEATEMAVKVARQYHLEKGNSGRYKTVSRWQGYSGSTFAALSFGGFTKRRTDYLPYMLDFPHIASPNCYRCQLAKEYPSCGAACAWQLEDTIKREGPSEIAAFIFEPIMGAGGAGITPVPEYYGIIREICDKYDVVMISDEVMTGFGRTGRNFGIDHWGVAPDIIAVGKGLSGSYCPLAATIISEKIIDTFKRSKRSGFSMGHTYSGNPLSCAIGLAALRYLKGNGLVERSATMGQYFIEKLKGLNKFDIVGDIRGRGLLLGVEFVADKRSKKPISREFKIAEYFASEAFARGLVIYSEYGIADGVEGDNILLAPPYIINEAEIDEIVSIVAGIINDLEPRVLKSARG